MNARELTAALGGRWHGASGEARCPAHEDKTPSLSIHDGDNGRLLTFCHARCSPEAVWAALQDRGLVKRAEDSTARRRRRRRQRPQPTPEPSPNQDHALKIWRASRPAAGAPAEAYLRGRGITIPIPPTIRYHPSLLHPSGRTLPAMVAGVQAINGRVVAIHRTFLRPDGQEKADVTPCKMALGPLGAGAVHIGAAAPAMGLAEGIETALSAMQLFQISVWAALGSRVDRVEVFEQVIEIHIFGDNGGPGRDAAEKAASTFNNQGRRVVLRYPPPEFGDWNDALQALSKVFV